MSDSVNKPSHYNAGGVEAIEGIRAALGDAFLDYCLGNVIKYVWRCKHKGNMIEDLRKAAKYLEWAIEAAESNCPETPDGSSGKAIAIPHGWRELEPDEMPLATDMHEWMGGWIVRTTDSGQPYKWHDHRNIRKIETPKPEPLAIPEGWRELEENEPLSENDLFELDGEWVGHEYDPSGGVYSSRIHRRHIRKIETANVSEAPNSSRAKQLAIPEGWRELERSETPKASDMVEHGSSWIARGGDSSVEYEWYDVRIIRKIEPANTSETPNSSLPDPGPGYRLLSKDPPERLIRGDEFWDASTKQWHDCKSVEGYEPQVTGYYYRRKIETTAWIPKVGDKVRVNRLGRLSDGKIGVIAERDAGEYTVRILGHDLTSFNLTADDLELIEAAS